MSNHFTGLSLGPPLGDQRLDLCDLYAFQSPAQSGHQRLKIAAVQLTPEAHFVDRQSLLEKKHTAACGGCAAAVDEIRFRP